MGMFKAGSVGLTIPSTETRIVDPLSGDDLGVDQDGEVWVRGPQVMKGYLNNDAATGSAKESRPFVGADERAPASLGWADGRPLVIRSL